MSWCSDTPQRIRWFACLQDCLLTLTCHLAHMLELLSRGRRVCRQSDTSWQGPRLGMSSWRVKVKKKNVTQCIPWKFQWMWARKMGRERLSGDWVCTWFPRPLSSTQYTWRLLRRCKYQHWKQVLVLRALYQPTWFPVPEQTKSVCATTIDKRVKHEWFVSVLGNVHDAFSEKKKLRVDLVLHTVPEESLHSGCRATPLVHRVGCTSPTV